MHYLQAPIFRFPVIYSAILKSEVRRDTARAFAVLLFHQRYLTFIKISLILHRLLRLLLSGDSRGQGPLFVFRNRSADPT